MKHFGNQLDELFRKKKIVQKDFAEKIGVSTVTISKWKSKESIDAAKLEIISKELNVPITYWFDKNDSVNQSIVNGNGSAASVYGNVVVGELEHKDEEIAHLKQLLEEKERTIQILMKNNI